MISCHVLLVAGLVSVTLQEVAGEDALNLLSIGGEALPAHTSSKSSAGNYEQYVKKYGGSYFNMSSGENYQNFIKQYGGGEGDSGYQKYADYQKYIKRYSKEANQHDIG